MTAVNTSDCTVTAIVPTRPSTVAEIVAVPTATPVTRPESETTATAGLSLLQVGTRPNTGRPAVSWTKLLTPTDAPRMIVKDAGRMATAPAGSWRRAPIAPVAVPPSLSHASLPGDRV